MDKMRPKTPLATDADSLADRHDESFVKGSVKESLRNMDKKSKTTHSESAASLTATGSDSDSHFEGEGYSVRQLPDEEARRVLSEREGVAARQDSTEDFLAFLMSRPAADDANP
jgi:hypothetical protein